MATFEGGMRHLFRATTTTAPFRMHVHLPMRVFVLVFVMPPTAFFPHVLFSLISARDILFLFSNSIRCWGR